MPQSNHDRTAELHNIPEHSAATAATEKTKAPHLSAHEETVQESQQEQHTHDSHGFEEKLHHGKAASEAAKK